MNELNTLKRKYALSASTLATLLGLSVRQVWRLLSGETTISSSMEVKVKETSKQLHDRRTEQLEGNPRAELIADLEDASNFMLSFQDEAIVGEFGSLPAAGVEMTQLALVRKSC